MLSLYDFITSVEYKMIIIILKNVLDLFIPCSVSEWELRLLSFKKNTNVP